MKNIKYKQTEVGEIPVEWNVAFISGCAEILDGDRGKSYPNGDDFTAEGYCLFLNTGNVSEKGFDFSKCQYISREKDETLGKGKLKKGDIVLTTRGTVGNFVHFNDETPFVNVRINSGMVIIRSKQSIDTDFLYQQLKSKQIEIQIKELSSGSAQPQLPIKDLRFLKIVVPTTQEQKQIASILSSLDDKIELNRKMNKTLEDMAKALFKHWFVDFEFPNEEGKPYKSSGGEMVESELGLIPKEWRAGCFAEAVSVYDSKRQPLSSMEREKRRGAYPYYGATGILDYVDEYIFNGEYVLLGEDGSVAKEDGSPYTQYVWGQFWVSNHAHVLQGARGFSTEYIKVLLDLTDITAYVTGAVQPKLNQENMNAIPIIIPSTSILKLFNGILKSFFIQMATNSIQIETITQIRDSLLPKLMSGKIRVN